MKAVKFLLKALLCLVVLLVIALLALPLWFGPVVKVVANAAVPGVVKTGFHLGHLSLNPYTARFELGDMQLWNPAGYSDKHAVKVGLIVADADTASLLTDVIRIEEITVKDVYASYVTGGENKVNNFTQIQYNVAGGKEKYEAAQAEKAQAEKAQAEQAQAEKAEAPAETNREEGPAKKVIIDKLTISGVKVQLGILPISVPFDITLTDIGKNSGGATLEEVWEQIASAVMKAAGNVGEAIGQLSKATGEVATKAAGDATKAVGRAAEATTKAAGDAVKSVGDSAGKALDAINKLW